MKISEVKAYVLESKLKPEEYFTWAQSQVTRRVATIVEIETDPARRYSGAPGIKIQYYVSCWRE